MTRHARCTRRPHHHHHHHHQASFLKSALPFLCYGDWYGCLLRSSWTRCTCPLLLLLSGAVCQTAQKTLEVPQLPFFAGRRHPSHGAVAYPHGPARSEYHRGSAVAVCQVVDAPVMQVVVISVVVQRQIPMVLFRTIDVLQSQHTDKVIDVPVVPVQFPSAGVETTAELPHCSRRALECSRWLELPHQLFPVP